MEIFSTKEIFGRGKIWSQKEIGEEEEDFLHGKIIFGEGRGEKIRTKEKISEEEKIGMKVEGKFAE